MRTFALLALLVCAHCVLGVDPEERALDGTGQETVGDKTLPVGIPEPILATAKGQYQYDGLGGAWKNLRRPWPVVKRGNGGLAVQVVQLMLEAWGFKVDPEGVFGKITEESVKFFQYNNDLIANGVVDADVWPVLVRTLHAGEESEAVKALTLVMREVYGMNVPITSKYSLEGLVTHPIGLVVKTPLGLAEDYIGVAEDATSGSRVAGVTWKVLLCNMQRHDDALNPNWAMRVDANYWGHPGSTAGPFDNGEDRPASRLKEIQARIQALTGKTIELKEAPVIQQSGEPPKTTQPSLAQHDVMNSAMNKVESRVHSEADNADGRSLKPPTYTGDGAPNGKNVRDVPQRQDNREWIEEAVNRLADYPWGEAVPIRDKLLMLQRKAVGVYPCAYDDGQGFLTTCIGFNLMRGGDVKDIVDAVVGADGSHLSYDKLTQDMSCRCPLDGGSNKIPKELCNVNEKVCTDLYSEDVGHYIRGTRNEWLGPACYDRLPRDVRVAAVDLCYQGLAGCKRYDTTKAFLCEGKYLEASQEIQKGATEDQRDVFYFETGPRGVVAAMLMGVYDKSPLGGSDPELEARVPEYHASNVAGALFPTTTTEV